MSGMWKPGCVPMINGSPFPEEINRRLASVVTDLHFAPTDWARQNLLRENIPPSQIIVTGNPVIDALQAVVKLPPTPAVLELFKRLGIPYQPSDTPQQTFAWFPRLILVTAHRRENFGSAPGNISVRPETN